jgi:amino acid adenylation domain-containing protein
MNDGASSVRLSLEEKRALLAARLKSKLRAAKYFPMSFAQQRLWFLDQIQPGSPLYNIPSVVPLRGTLNLVALQKALNEVVRRHEVMRTTFARVNEQPMQVIAPSASPVLSVADLRELAEDCREVEMRRLYEVEGKISFDLARGPLLRVKLLWLRPEEQLLIFTVHHIIFDGWSAGVLLKEITALYQSFCRSAPSPLPELSIQYADFAVWQHKRLRGDLLEKGIAYWKEQLQGIPVVLNLPRDRSTTKAPQAAGAELSLVVPAPLSQQLKSLSQHEGATLFMLLLAAFQTLLHRYTGQSTIVVGTPIAGRDRAELEALIGLFVNTLVLRADYGDDPTFRQLLARVKQTALEAYAHQSVPFERVVEELRPERGLDYSPLFQVMFSLQSVAYGESELERLSSFGNEVKSIGAGLDLPLSKFDLTLSAVETKTRLYCSLQYRTDMFDESTIRRLLENFRVLLQSIVDAPDDHVSALPILAAAEARRLIVEWNDTDKDYPSELSVAQMFAAQAERTPEGIALVCRARQISYRKLNERAGRLAGLLRTRGVRTEVLVGLFAEPSPEMIVGLLAVLKAGGAYLPLDPAASPQRLKSLLADAQASLVLTPAHLSSRLREDTTAVVLLDEDDKFTAPESEAELAERGPAQAAYVIYVSDSQGKPRGIVIEDRQVANSLQILAEHVTFAPGTSWAVQSPLTANSAQKLILASLCGGATLHVIAGDQATATAPRDQHLAQVPIDGLLIAPSQLVTMLGDMGVDSPLPRRWLVLGGEPARREWIEELQAKFPDLSVVNHYAPTEATGAGLTCLVKNASVDHVDRDIPVGRPSPNTKTYVLDLRLQPVPIGVAGELYIGGDFLARGYLNRVRETAEKFIPDPFSRSHGARLYKTGDVARQLPDGNLLLLGRTGDRQLKIRGFRIEPEEVEVVLRPHPSVRETLVMAQEDALGSKQLVMYLVAADDDDDESGVRAVVWQMLKKSLPVEMLPSAIIFLDELPLAADGKVAVQLLPSPYAAISEAPREFVAPRDTIELQLALIWEGLLGVAPISVTDNFFDLGGHSLLAIRMMAKAHQQLGRRIPLAALFERGTIEHLAAMVRLGTDAEAESPLVAIQPRGDRQPFFCVHGIGGGVIDYLHLARHLGTEQPFYGLQATGADADSSVEGMASRYLEAVRKVQPGGPYLLGGWSFGGLIAFEMARQFQELGQEVAMLALFDSIAPGFIDRSAYLDVPDTNDPAQVARFISGTMGNDPGAASLDDRESYTPAEQLQRAFEHAKQERAVPAEIELPEFLVWLAGLRKGMLAEREYLPTAYAGRLTLFKARELSSHSESIREQLARDPTYGWGRLCSQGVEPRFVPGSHHTIILEPNVSALAEQLKRWVAQIKLGAKL